MINHHILLAVSQERQVDLLGHAAVERRARASGARRPRRVRLHGTPVSVRGGSEVLVRPLKPDDGPLLADGFQRLSLQSRQARFLSPKPTLTERDLSRLTDVDHRNHEALAAVDARDGRGVGVARFIRDAQDPQSAEIAITVVDEWHRRGVATELLSRLAARARQEGIVRFTALIAADNYAVLALLRKLALDLKVVAHDGETAELSIALAGFAQTVPTSYGTITSRLVRRFSFRRVVVE